MTAVAASIHIAVMVWVAGIGLLLAVLGMLVSSLDDSGRAKYVLAALGGITLLGAAGVFVGVHVLLVRQWARRTLVVFYAAVVVTAISVAAFGGANDPAFGLFVAPPLVGAVPVLILLLHPRTAREFENRRG